MKTVDQVDGVDRVDGVDNVVAFPGCRAGGTWVDPASRGASQGKPGTTGLEDCGLRSGTSAAGPLYRVSVVEPVGQQELLVGGRDRFLDAAMLAGREARRMGAPCGLVRAGLVSWVVPVDGECFKKLGLRARSWQWVLGLLRKGGAAESRAAAVAEARALAAEGRPVVTRWQG